MIRVLIIDDDEAVRYDLRRFNKWKDYGFEIIAEAEDGFEALELLKNQSFDIIFVDIKMPRINGLAFLSTLRENKNNTTVVIMSGYSDFEYAKQCIKLGAYDYLLKPIDEIELTGLLTEVAVHIQNKKTDKKEEPDLIELTESQAIINRICEYINLNLSNDITLETIASHFGYSSKHLGKLFRKYKSEGFVNYITHVKMEKAKELILSGKYKNYEISNLLGYENADYFTILFKKHFGVTPLEFRKAKVPVRSL